VARLDQTVVVADAATSLLRNIRAGRRRAHLIRERSSAISSAMERQAGSSELSAQASGFEQMHVGIGLERPAD